MYASRRSPKRPALILTLLIAVFLTTACASTALGGFNWPGLTADDQYVYVAYGPRVTAVDVASQEVVWSFPAENSRASFLAPPAVNGEQIILGDYGVPRGMFSPGVIVTLYGLEAPENGATVPTIAWEQGGVATDRIIAAPLLADDKVFIGAADNFLMALNANSGSLLWRYEMGHSIWSQPTLVDGTLYVTSMDRSVYALNPETGDLIWRTSLNGAIAAKPVVVDGVVYVSSFDNTLHALQATNGEELWSAQATDWIWSAPAVNTTHVYLADASGLVLALQRDSGEKVWEYQASGPIQASPVTHDDMVYIASQGDNVQGEIIALSSADGSVVWQRATPAPVFTTPVIINDALVVAVQSDSGLLLVYNAIDGAERWVYNPSTE